MVRVLFVQNIWYQFPALMSLAAVAKQDGHRCAVAIAPHAAEALRAVERERPDLVGFPVLTGNHPWALATARAIKQRRPGLPIIFGGIHPTLFPELIVDPAVDLVCRGEGENAFRALLAALAAGRMRTDIPGLWVKAGGVVHRNELGPLVDIDALPCFDRDLYAGYRFFDGEPVGVALTRYCPYECSFCINHVLKRLYRGRGKFCRTRDRESILAELAALKQRLPAATFVFEADTLNVDEAWLLGFLAGYRERIGRPFICTVVADRLTEAQAAALQESGCVCLSFSPETGDETLRREVVQKPIRDEHYRRAAALCHRHRIPFVTANILGFPGETLEQSWATVRFNRELRPAVAMAALLQPYPQTDVAAYALRHGYLERSDPDAMSLTNYNVYLLRHDRRRELINLQRLFIVAVHCPRLEPLIRRLIALPPNRLFDLIFLCAHTFYLKLFHQRNWWQMLRFAARYLPLFLRRR